MDEQTVKEKDNKKIYGLQISVVIYKHFFTINERALLCAQVCIFTLNKLFIC